MKDETFKKVWIKSENDLPKEEGWYFVFHSATGMQCRAYSNDLGNRLQWIEEFDWYLQPILQSE